MVNVIVFHLRLKLIAIESVWEIIFNFVFPITSFGGPEYWDNNYQRNYRFTIVYPGQYLIIVFNRFAHFKYVFSPISP